MQKENGNLHKIKTNTVACMRLGLAKLRINYLCIIGFCYQCHSRIWSVLYNYTWLMYTGHYCCLCTKYCCYKRYYWSNPWPRRSNFLHLHPKFWCKVFASYHCCRFPLCHEMGSLLTESVVEMLIKEMIQCNFDKMQSHETSWNWK